LNHIRQRIEQFNHDEVTGVARETSLSDFQLQSEGSLGVVGHVVGRIQLNYGNESAETSVLRLDSNPGPLPPPVSYCGVVGRV
jgi:hypothetical protein